MLVVVHVVVCILLVFLVMMQRPRQEGLGAAFGAGLTDQMFGAQTTNVLQKGTVWLGVMFFVITLVLAILISKRHSADAAFLETMKEGAPAAETSGLPELPKPPEALDATPGSAAPSTTAVKVVAPEGAKPGEAAQESAAPATEGEKAAAPKEEAPAESDATESKADSAKAEEASGEEKAE